MDILKSLDIFPKVKDEYRIRTSTGAIISITALILMSLLFFSELSLFFQVNVNDELYVNTAVSQKLRVSFDISFHEIPCSLLALDVVDDTGIVQKDATHHVYKHKLTKGKLLPLSLCYPQLPSLS